jgi:hypothetical protein
MFPVLTRMKIQPKMDVPSQRTDRIVASFLTSLHLLYKAAHVPQT